jgi:branched-chain amino acid transport system ATP-binding protein
MSFLSVEEIVKDYDGVRALDEVSFEVRKGTIKGLIGPNGAGKTTLFHLITGIEAPTSGKISFKGMDITSMEPHEISLLGVGRTFQTLQVWGNMTVVENVMAGMHTRLRGGFLSCGLWFPWVKRTEREALQEAKGILEFLGLLGRWKWPASQLSFGEQRILELGRVLAMRPELMLLDEPAAGLTTAEVTRLTEGIRHLRKDGLTIFIIEHHMGMVMEIADEIAVLDNGELVAEGMPDVVASDQRVIDAYLKATRTDA